MSVRGYLLGILATTILCFAAFALIVMVIDPEKANVWIFAGLFTSLGLGVMGAFMVLGYLVRRLTSNNEVVFSHITVLARQGFLLALGVTSLVIMQVTRILTWWDALMLVVILALVELYFYARK